MLYICALNEFKSFFYWFTCSSKDIVTVLFEILRYSMYYKLFCNRWLDFYYVGNIFKDLWNKTDLLVPPEF